MKNIPKKKWSIRKAAWKIARKTGGKHRRKVLRKISATFDFG